HDVADVDELGLVEPREVHAHLDDVVAGLRLNFGGVLGRLLRSGDVVDLDLDPGVLGEPGGDRVQLLVRGRSEVVPAEVRDLSRRARAGRRHEETGQTDAGGRQELTATDG